MPPRPDRRRRSHDVTRPLATLLGLLWAASANAEPPSAEPPGTGSGSTGSGNTGSGNATSDTSPSGSDHPVSAPPLEWNAPDGCPSGQDVLSRVATLAAGDAVRWTRFDTIGAQVTHAGNTWRLALSFVGPGGTRTRELEGRRCEDLADAAAVAIVLAHRIGDGSSDGWDTPSDGRATTPTSPHEAAPEEPAREAVAMNAPAASTDAPGPDTEPAAPAPAPGEPLPLALRVGAEALLDPTTLGTAAFGASAGVTLQLGPVSAGAYAFGFPSVDTPLGTGQALALGLWGGGLRGCYHWVPALSTCALMELGELSASGVGLSQARDARDTWVAPGLSMELTSTPFEAFGVTTRLSAFHPLVRGQFRVDDGDVVHRVPAVTFRAALGVDFSLF